MPTSVLWAECSCLPRTLNRKKHGDTWFTTLDIWPPRDGIKQQAGPSRGEEVLGRSSQDGVGALADGTPTSALVLPACKDLGEDGCL